MPEECRAFFSAPLPESKMKSPLPELGRDVAMMVLCLGGMNTVDIYHLRKEDYQDGIIRYRRAKTRKFRADEAYMEMRVPPIIQPLVEKYKAADDDVHLFNFSTRHTTTDSFNANVNTGIKAICKSLGIPKDQQKRENQDWYDRRYNEDATQRADAQRLLTMTEESIKKRNKAAAGTAAVMGGTDESVAATKEANSQALADATSQIAAAAEQRKDQIEQQYQQRKDNLDQQLMELQGQKQSVLNAAIGGAASGLGSALG